ncbi:MAG: hypothetical protein AAGI51_06140 [Pseudomonadota bacterium]
MRMLRYTGWGFLVLAALAMLKDAEESVNGAFSFASLGQRWSEVHKTSLIGLQSGLENRVNPDVFFDYVLPFLEFPAAGVFGVAAALCLLPSAFVRGPRAVGLGR